MGVKKSLRFEITNPSRKKTSQSVAQFQGLKGQKLILGLACRQSH